MRERPKSICDSWTSSPRCPARISARGGEVFFYVSHPQTIEFFAGGNDEVELRVDGELLLRRSLADGMRTIGRQVHLDAGAHEIAVDYQQFGGSMALNIQRALEGQAAGAIFAGRAVCTGTSTRARSCCSMRRAGCDGSRHTYGPALPFC